MPIFKDSYGSEIKEGDKILIEKSYDYPYPDSRVAIVFWDKEHGMYQFKTINGASNFYGIQKFRKLIQ